MVNDGDEQFSEYQSLETRVLSHSCAASDLDGTAPVRGRLARRLAAAVRLREHRYGFAEPVEVLSPTVRPRCSSKASTATSTRHRHGQHEQRHALRPHQRFRLERRRRDLLRGHRYQRGGGRARSARGHLQGGNASTSPPCGRTSTSTGRSTCSTCCSSYRCGVTAVSRRPIIWCRCCSRRRRRDVLGRRAYGLQRRRLHPWTPSNWTPRDSTTRSSAAW